MDGMTVTRHFHEKYKKESEEIPITLENLREWTRKIANRYPNANVVYGDRDRIKEITGSITIQETLDNKCYTGNKIFWKVRKPDSTDQNWLYRFLWCHLETLNDQEHH